MKFDNQLRYATNIIEQYDGRVPLSSWLKDFFRANKQMGSRDRKTVSQMVYGFYRLGHNEFSSIEDRIKAFINVTDILPEVKEHFFPESPGADQVFPDVYVFVKVNIERVGLVFQFMGNAINGLFFFGLESAKHTVPDNKGGSVILVNIFLL